MDDSCAVCVDPLEWVAYGRCGHREVCSTCVVRLRFVLQDRRCCICKNESPTIFVTKALGDYTRVITDFSAFPAGANEGRIGLYWYHEGSQAYFDDVDHYRMINAMCRLSCSICDKNAEQETESTKRKSRFRNIEQLKGHLFHQHSMLMCSLCLEGRKVFICEQKLYTRSQLNQHVRTGDLEVDGSESERGGFMGHPVCEFCKNPFYGDNELYMHMSTEHYTCHICQRQHPGRYDYFKNYDDLETHFRQVHFLCEDEACLEKKFIVFQTDTEMKRHNAIEHGGHMSRSKRNAALQIPTSFIYRRSNGQDLRQGRGCGIRHDPSNNQLSSESSGGMSRADMVTDPVESFIANSVSNAPPRSDHIPEESYFSPLFNRPPESSSIYAHALNQGSAVSLREELFPPLPSKKKSRKSKHRAERVGNNSLAFGPNRNKGCVKIRYSSWRIPSETHEASTSSPASSPQLRPVQHQGLTTSKPQPATTQFVKTSTPERENGFATPIFSDCSWTSVSGNRMKHSSSAPNLVNAPKQPLVDPVSIAVGKHAVEEIHTANRSLVERIRIGLGNDEERYATFKCVSSEYREDQINSWEYISYVKQFGLMHLVHELARLCPDPQKQNELVDAYDASIWNDAQQENYSTGTSTSKERNHQKNKGKGIVVDHDGDASGKFELADSLLNKVRKLQLNQKHQAEEEMEILTKDGCRTSKSISNSCSVRVNLIDSNGTKKHHKTSKIQRVRLGDTSEAALLEVGRANSSTECIVKKKPTYKPPTALPVRGVWKKNGAQKLFAK